MIDTGVILAAGKGTRLNEMTRAVPKELLTVGDRPIIDFSVRAFQEACVEKLIVVVGYHKKAIIDYLGSGERYGIDIAYVFQEEQLGTGNALSYARKFLDGDFCLVFGDDYVEPSNYLKILTESHNSKSASATIGICKVSDARTTSIIKVENTVVKKIIEKPEQKELWGNLGSNGTFVLSMEIFDYIKKTKPSLNGEIYLSEAIDLMVQDGKNVFGIENCDYFMDIGILDRYLKANEIFFATRRS